MIPGNALLGESGKLFLATGHKISVHEAQQVTNYAYFLLCHPTKCSMTFNVDHSYASRKNKIIEIKRILEYIDSSLTEPLQLLLLLLPSFIILVTVRRLTMNHELQR